jgi:hypothetical protein
VQDDVEKGTVDFKLTVIADETQFPEPVHEEIDSRAGGAHHLCQSLLTDPWDRNFGLSVLAELSEQEENASKAFLAGIEKLVNQIFLEPDIPRQQICHEHI